MIERLLDTWLDKANERSFQIPFCHWLTYSGHNVLHMTRHCAMEMGKDILSIDPDGVPCAFQLKSVSGKRLTIGEWRADLGKQISPLVNERIVHPGINTASSHRSILVINGHLDEEVSRAIDDFNQKNAADGYPNRKIEVLLKGDLLKSFLEMKSEFWPTSLSGIRDYLELLSCEGNGQLDKRRLCNIISSILPLSEVFEESASLTEHQIVRLALSSALFCATAISNYTNSSNHVAEFEAWTLLLLYCHAAAERFNLPCSALHNITNIIENAIYTSLARLCDEVLEREHYVEGVAFHAIADAFVYRTRLTSLLGLLAVYGLMRDNRVAKGIEGMDELLDRRLHTFFRSNMRLMSTWGESAIPQILAINYYARRIVTFREHELQYFNLIKTIVDASASRTGLGLPNPYYGPEKALPLIMGLTEDAPPRVIQRIFVLLGGLATLGSKD